MRVPARNRRLQLCHGILVRAWSPDRHVGQDLGVDREHGGLMSAGPTDPSAARSPILRVLLPFTAAFFVQEMHRTVSAVVATPAMAELGLSAAEMGRAASVYFLAFAAVQLPLGLWLDRYGPRRVIAAFLAVAAIGGAVFAAAPGGAGLTLGRALLGAGGGACLMAAFKANASWFPIRRLALANSAVLGLGGLGGLVATAPAQMLIELVGWRTAYGGLAAATLAVAVLVLAVAPERAEAQPPASAPGWQQLAQYLAILRSPVFRRIAPVASLLPAAMVAYQGLWAGRWLLDVAGAGDATVARSLFWLAAAIVLGYVLCGVAVDVLRARGWSPVTGLAVGVALAILCQLALASGAITVALPLWTLFGLCAAGTVAFYAVLTERFPPALAGRVNSALNFILFATAFALQYGIGEIAALWPTGPQGGYPPAAHQAALLGVAALEAVALAWLLRPGGGAGYRGSISTIE